MAIGIIRSNHRLRDVINVRGLSDVAEWAVIGVYGISILILYIWAYFTFRILKSATPLVVAESELRENIASVFQNAHADTGQVFELEQVPEHIRITYKTGLAGKSVTNTGYRKLKYVCTVTFNESKKRVRLRTTTMDFEASLMGVHLRAHRITPRQTT